MWIEQGHFQWVANFYIIFVAEPGVVAKTTTMGTGMRLLREVPGIHMGPSSLTWQSLVMRMANSAEQILLPDGSYLPMCAITCAAGELGTFLNPNDREMIDVLVALWDGRLENFEKETKTQGNDVVQNPWINIIGATTPGWISENLPEYIINGGFASRCIFVAAQKKKQLIAYPSRHYTEATWAKQRAELVHDLEQISLLVGQYTLDEATYELGEIWYARLNTNIPEHLNNERFKGYLARKQTHVHKLAMIVAASKRDDLRIMPEDLQFSIDMIEALELEMPFIYRNLGTSAQGKLTRHVVEDSRTHSKTTQTDQYARLHRTMSFKEYEQAIMSAIQGGFIERVSAGMDMYVVYKSGKGFYE